VATAFVSYIQTRLLLTTAFVSLLLGHKNSSPLACPLFLPFALLLLLLLPFVAAVSSSRNKSVHCLPLPRSGSPPPSPFDQPLSRLSLSPRFCFCGHHNHVEVLSQPPPPPLRPHHHVSLSESGDVRSPSFYVLSNIYVGFYLVEKMAVTVDSGIRALQFLWIGLFLLLLLLLFIPV